MRRYIWWIVGAVLLCVIAACAFWYSQLNIVLRLSSGFTPSVMHIDPHESITFLNLTRLPSWPASGPHPTHTTYPAFDPQEGIDPWDSWSFTFDSEGTYAYHDHFAPLVSGIIVVGSQDISNVTDQSTCSELPDTQLQIGCIEIYFKNVAEKESFPATLEIFREVTARYPGSCHTFAHDLGKSAYQAYLEDSFIDIGEESASCGYGFWHGFTTAMQSHRGVNASKEYCAQLEGETDLLLRANRMNCYHGIGIGLIPDPPQPHLWGSFEGLVDPALAFCDTVQGDPYYKDRCLTGIFHAMTIYMMEGLYGFTFNENSLSYCAVQAPEHQSACFNTLVAGLPNATDFDLARTAALLEQNVPDDLFEEIFKNAAIIFVDAEASVEETGLFVQECGSIDPNLRSLCIQAVINKLYNNGLPGIEYLKAQAFCEGVWILKTERSACFKEVITYATQVYPPEKAREVCGSIPFIERVQIWECLAP